MSDIQIHSGEASATVTTDGGWLTTFEVAGMPVLFPLTTVGDKKRGGSHVCVPNFGPGGDSGLPQHGFGRTAQWQIAKQADNRVVLSLKEVPADYAGLELRLTYELSDTGIEMTLQAENSGDTPLQLAPAFHPYFNNAGGSEVMVDEKTYNVEQLSDMVSLPNTPQSLRTSAVQCQVTSQELPDWVLWTDGLAEYDYICLEPTRSGYSFTDDVAKQPDVLAPAAGAEWSMKIEVQEESQGL